MIKRIAKKIFKPVNIERPVIDRDSESVWKAPASSEEECRLGLLSNKNVLITGAGRNIGRRIALEMAHQGADIYFTDIDSDRIEKVEREIRQLNVNVAGFMADISNTEHSDVLVETLKDRNINIDVLIQNVGIQYMTEQILNLKMEEWTRTYATNIFGPVYLTKRMAESMIANSVPGSIIFITSIHENAISRWPSYSSSKAALNMLIRELAIDLSVHDIRVNGIAPGAVEDEIEKQKWAHIYTPLRQKLIDSRYIGRAAVYLASDYFSKQTTGTILKIDGGLTLYNHRVAEAPPGRMT